MFTRILVPTDFTTASDAALAYGRTLAGRFNATLHLMYVSENLFLRAVVADPRDAEAAARRRLDECLTEDDRQTLGAVSVVERSDEPADEIVSYARTAEADLIVMGTHGRSDMAHLLVGSVAERVVRTAPCPVLTVREARLVPRSAPFTRLLVPTDFSPASDAALTYARLLAATLGGSLHLLHVVNDPVTAGPFGPQPDVYVGQDAVTTRSALQQDARKQLVRRITPVDRSRFHATSEVIFGKVADTIARYADVNGFDLIVMGTHGRTGMAHLFMGSVAERVVRTARCPVLTAHTVPQPVRVPFVGSGTVAAGGSPWRPRPH